MNDLLSGYFDAAHRGLLPPQVKSQINIEPTTDDHAYAHPRLSDSVDNLSTLVLPIDGKSNDLTEIKLLREELSRLRETVRECESVSALAVAKNEELKKDNLRLSEENVSLKSRLETFFVEASLNSEDCKAWKSRAAEALKALSSLRESHTHETRTMQRTIAAASGKGTFTVSDAAELVDQLGKICLQRDEALKEKCKLDELVQKNKEQLTAATNEVRRINKINRELSKKNDKLEKINKIILKGSPKEAPPQGPSREAPLTENSEEFDRKLKAFEKRYSVLGEGTLGAEFHICSLEDEIKHLKGKQVILESDNTSLRNDADRWRSILNQREQEVNSLHMEISRLEDALHSSSQAEANLFEKLSQITQQFDLYKIQTEANVNSNLFDSQQQIAIDQFQTLIAHKDQEPAPPIVSVCQELHEETEIIKPVYILTHTGETAEVSVFKNVTNHKIYIKATESGEIYYLQLSDPQVDEVLSLGDVADIDAWHELIFTVGFAMNPIKQLVLPEIIFNDTVFLAPADVPLVLAIYRYDQHRVYLSGFDDVHQRLVELSILLTDEESEHSSQWILKQLRLEEKDDQTLIIAFLR